MDPLLTLAARFGVALGIGLIIGAERERHRRVRGHETSAGIRTFTLIALTGALASAIAGTIGGAGGAIVIVGTLAAVTALIGIGYVRDRTSEPGMTTEVAEIATMLLGVLAIVQPPIAAGLAVVVTVLLMARSPLHAFVTKVLSQQEMQDALVFLAASLVVLPLLPDRAIGPYGVFVPSRIWQIAVVVMAIAGAGHIGMRALGERYGLPVVGFASGFVSSAATTAAMGMRAKAHPEQGRRAAAGAALSSASTLVLLAIVLSLASPAVLRVMMVPLVSAIIVALAWGALFTYDSLSAPQVAEPRGRAFDPKVAVLFALGVTALLFVAAAAQRMFGGTGALVAAGIAGLADTHAAAYSVASLARTTQLTPQAAGLGVLIALTANTGAKAVIAVMAGGTTFALRVVPGLALMLTAAWGGAWLVGLA